jgi:hypothetical protein
LPGEAILERGSEAPEDGAGSCGGGVGEGALFPKSFFHFSLPVSKDMGRVEGECVNLRRGGIDG